MPKQKDEEEKQQNAAASLLVNLEYKKPKTKPKNLVKGYKPMDNRQVTHNLRRRMGR